ncbi:putative baseplate assembly protein [Sorangium sp. So ce375]|uniref:putative baseplate assembly protein n=1 Tax=Sorangium sp. So ce375 TaxID=3133306 RepID=UPI003F5B12A1
MPIPSPPVLGSEYDDIAERTEKLAAAFTRTTDAQGNSVPGWTPPAGDEVDLGRALVRVFARMARHAIDRVNRVPERSFLAFLDRTGVTPAEARAARVPLTFTLVARGDAEPTVPGQTRVGAKPLPGDAREVVFETEHDLRTTRAKLAAVFVRQPDGDRLSEHTAEATGARDAFFEAFDGGAAAPHMMYLAADDVLGLPAGTPVTVTFTVDDAAKWQALHAPQAPLVRWTYWNGAAWSSLTLDAVPTTSITFKIPSDIAKISINGRSARFLRAELQAWPAAGVPKLLGAQVMTTQTQTNVAPTAALSSGRVLDLSLDFYPFGEQPRLNDHLLLACDQVLRPGASVTVNVTLNDTTQPLKATDAPVLTWEISTGTGWKVVLADVKPTSATAKDVLRTTTPFVVPAEAAPMTIGSTKATWLRIRLSGGSFGKGLAIDYNLTPPKMTDDGYRPPIVKSITLTSTATIKNTKPLCTTEDERACVDRDLAAPFAPFTRSGEAARTLYLGFDRAFAPLDTYLYFQVAPLDPVSAAKEANAAVSGSVTWEYSSSGGAWTPLVCEDGTGAFSASGLVRFVGPKDFGRKALFARDLFWIRARSQLPAGVSSPRLGHVLTNTVWAYDATARTNEILGSADGSAGQSFKLAARPVLAGQRVEVREPSAPEGEERRALVEAEGDDAVSSEVDPAFPGQVWVRWHEVEDFYASGPRDRHYTIDREAGVVRFGDGRRGMAPPWASRNVRAKAYATGGGADGNRPAGTVVALKTTVPYVDGVTNHERATGGADADTPGDVKTWGPSVVRHGYRAVTAQDFEDLALEASPAVARARVITPDFDVIKAADNPDTAGLGALAPGALVLLIATNGPDVPPAATTGLLREVDAYLRARSGPAVTLRIAGPSWIEVSVTQLDVVASSASGLEALRDRIERALVAFFHPITGNTDGGGWAFGALPHESDVYRFVMAIPGVHRIGALTWTMSPTGSSAGPPEPDSPTRARVLIYPGRQTVQIFSPGGT